MQNLAQRARTIMRLLDGDDKHLASAMLSVDIIAALYGSVLRRDADGNLIDEFYLSRGHGPMGYYAVLAGAGEIEMADIFQFGTFHGRLGHHPDRHRVPAFGISSGSLGHGLGLGSGTALARRILGQDGRIFVLAGDAEMDEGSVWEAVAFAGRCNLSNLTLIVADNASDTLGWPGGIDTRLAAEGWNALRVDGADVTLLTEAMASSHPDRPTGIVCSMASGVFR